MCQVSWWHKNVDPEFLLEQQIKIVSVSWLCHLHSDTCVHYSDLLSDNNSHRMTYSHTVLVNNINQSAFYCSFSCTNRDGVPFCERDYQAEFGVTCAGCGGYITGKVLQVRQFLLNAH